MSIAASTALGRIESDLTHWPVAVVRPPPVPIEDEAIHAFMDRFECELTARGPQFAIVLDLRMASNMAPAQRRMLVSRMRQSDGQRQQVAGAFVFSSTIMRGLLTAVLWLRTPPYPTQVFTSVEEAVQWARQQCDAGGLLIRPSQEPSPTFEGRAVTAAKLADVPVAASASASDIETRLLSLDSLKSKGLITEDEHAERRLQILDEL